MKKGINAWCFPGNYTIEKCMEISAAAGFDGIEINMTEEMTEKSSGQTITEQLSFTENTALTLTFGEREIQDIKRCAKKYGLDIPSISTSLLWRYPLTGNEEKVREKAIEIVRRMIDAAQVLGADTVLVVPGLVDTRVSYKTAMERSIEALKELSKYAEEKKVYIGIENVWNKFLLSPIEMRQFIEKINSPFAGAYFDVGNVLNFSYPEYWIEILSDTIRKIHVKDFNTSVGNISGFTNLLAGDVDWVRVMEYLKKINYENYLIAELAPYKIFPEKLAQDTSTSLDKIIGG